MILPAGQGGETEDQVLSEDFATQLRQALRNTETVLQAAGAKMSDVAKFNLLIVDHNEEKFRAVRAEFDRVWGDRKPAWTLIPVPAWPSRACLSKSTSSQSSRAEGREIVTRTVINPWTCGDAVRFVQGVDSSRVTWIVHCAGQGDGNHHDGAARHPGGVAAQIDHPVIAVVPA